MNQKEKPATGQVTGKIERKQRKDTTQFDFLLNDAGILQYFDQLAKIAETRQNPFIQNRMDQNLTLIKKAFADLLDTINTVYSENRNLKKAISDEKEFLIFCAQEVGFDPNFWNHMFQCEKTKVATLASAEKTFAAGIAFMKAKFPDHYKKYFDGTESN
jgi:hypothetical protein